MNGRIKRDAHRSSKDSSEGTVADEQKYLDG